MQTRLISLELPSTLLNLSIAIYPPRAWEKLGSIVSEQDIEDWATRKGIAEWTWRTIASLKDNGEQNNEYLGEISAQAPNITYDL